MIGLGEAVITGLVVRFILADPPRPDLITIPRKASSRNSTGRILARRWASTVLAGLGVALAVAVFLSPLASEFPDGLEFVGERIGFLRDDPAPSPLPVPMPDYQLTYPRHCRM